MPRIDEALQNHIPFDLSTDEIDYQGIAVWAVNGDEITCQSSLGLIYRAERDLVYAPEVERAVVRQSLTTLVHDYIVDRKSRSLDVTLERIALYNGYLSLREPAALAVEFGVGPDAQRNIRSRMYEHFRVAHPNFSDLFAKLRPGIELTPVPDVPKASKPAAITPPVKVEKPCRMESPDAFFERGAQQRAAAKICLTRCANIDACRQEALDNRIEWGVWGGMTERERRAYHRRNDTTAAGA